jgi:creatinine amidohydrolase
MRLLTAALALATTALLPPSLATSVSSAALQREARTPRGQRLADMTWMEAQAVLTPDAVVVIPLGAASKEHGPHLKLRNDLALAEHLTEQILNRATVVAAPPLTYHYHPAFVEYAGSTSLSLDTARDLTTEVVRSLARHGPRRFYVLNTGISTIQPLEGAAKALAADGILLRFTALDGRLQTAARDVAQQEGGAHADEIETSMMLHLDPASVDMGKAVKDYSPRSTPFVLTRQRDRPGTYSPSGIWGDPTLATAAKGRAIVDALVAGILADIEDTRTAVLPVPFQTTPEVASTAARGATPDRQLPDRCSEGDERAIRSIADAFTAFWANADAERIAGLWANSGDMMHPDGYIERGPIVIRQNRAALFARRDYRSTRHPLTIGLVRCLANDIAVADGKWELRGVLGPSGQPVPWTSGLVTLAVKRHGGAWLIEAYRYTIDTPNEPVPPTLLKRPGYPGRGGGSGSEG